MILLQHGLSMTCWCKWQTSAMFHSTTSKHCTTFKNVYQKWVDRFRLEKIPEPEESAGYIIAHMHGKKTVSEKIQLLYMVN